MALTLVSGSRMSSESRFKYVWTGLGLAAVALLAFGAWVWNRSAEERAVRHLPAEERRTLYDRTLRTLQDPCLPSKRASGLDAFCREQAEFIMEFPECDAVCVALARRYIAVPSR